MTFTLVVKTSQRLAASLHCAPMLGTPNPLLIVCNIMVYVILWLKDLQVGLLLNFEFVYCMIILDLYIYMTPKVQRSKGHTFVGCTVLCIDVLFYCTGVRPLKSS